MHGWSVRQNLRLWCCRAPNLRAFPWGSRNRFPIRVGHVLSDEVYVGKRKGGGAQSVSVSISGRSGEWTTKVSGREKGNRILTEPLVVPAANIDTDLVLGV